MRNQQVTHPCEIGVFVLLGHKLNVAVFYRRDGGFRQRPNFDKPLVGQQGFDDGIGAIAPRHHELVILDLLQQTQGVKIDDLLACRNAIQTLIDLRCRIVNGGFWSENIDQRQIVATPISLSLKSCAGVIFTQPVPKSRST